MSAPMKENISDVRSDGDSRMDQFKQSFKFFKRRKPPPDFTSVIDFRTCDSNDHVQQVTLPGKQTVGEFSCQRYGLKPAEDWNAFSLSGVPGFIFLQDPFLPGYQRYWIKRCLKDFPKKPNVCNLDAHMTIKDDDCLWDKSQTHLRKASSDSKSVIQQLHWVTFGYHHNWDTKVYEEDHHSPFPSDLAGMTELIAGVLGYQHYKAEAAIVNYYHLDSTLGGHTDHSEFDLDMPIISYSFGQSAVFLVGGQTREQTPEAMFLHSGDIIVMGGPSRLAYHAVPRILPSTDGNIPKCLQSFPELTSESHERVSAREKSPGVHASVKEDLECTFTGTNLADGCSGIQKNDAEVGKALRSSDLNNEMDMSARKKRSNESDIDCLDLEHSFVSSAKVLCTEQSNFPMRTFPNTDLLSKESVGISDTFDINMELRDLCSSENWDAFAAYLKSSRINVSVRQVKKPGQEFPAKSD